MKLAIVEDSELVRDQLIRGFSSNPAISIVGFAVAEEQAVTLILRTNPDVVLMDLSLLEGNGIRVLERIRGAGCAVKVMVLSNNMNAAMISACQAHGISGYFDKSRDTQACLDRIAKWAAHPGVVDSAFADSDAVAERDMAPANEAAFLPAFRGQYSLGTGQAAARALSERAPAAGAGFETERVGGMAGLWRSIRRAPELKHRLYRFGHALLSAGKIGAMCDWLTGNGNAPLTRELARSARLEEVLFRPYVNRYWGIGDRMRAIEDHYRHLADTASVLDIGDNVCRKIASLELEQQTLRLAVYRPHWMPLEGEMGLNLYLGDNRIYTVMFLLGDDGEGNTAMIVGCLVGWRNESAKDDFKALTKELHGVRPRDLILHMAKLVAAELGCTTLLCVSDDAHRGSHWLSSATKQASFDTYWNEHGGQLREDGFYAIPARITVKEHDEIPAKKRAQYKRRYAMLDSMRDQIQRSFAAFKATNKAAR